MAQLGELTLPVRLTVGDVTSSVIGEIGWPVHSAATDLTGHGVTVAVRPARFDEVRQSLASLLRAAADEIENPSTSEL